MIKYTLGETPVCSECGGPFDEQAFWKEDVGYVCAGCIHNGS